MPLVGPSLAILVVSLVMMALSIVSVLLRLLVRIHIVRAFGWDDGLMVAALVGYPPKECTAGFTHCLQAVFITLTACSSVGAMNGAGHARSEFTSHNLYRKALLVCLISIEDTSPGRPSFGSYQFHVC